MKKWFGLILTGIIFCEAGTSMAQRNGAAGPSLRVACNVLAADIRLDGNSVVANKPIELKKGQQYTLAVTKPGYVPYRKSF